MCVFFFYFWVGEESYDLWRVMQVANYISRYYPLARDYNVAASKELECYWTSGRKPAFAFRKLRGISILVIPEIWGKNLVNERRMKEYDASQKYCTRLASAM